MLYEVIVKNTSGGIIHHSTNSSLANILTIREALINRFTNDNEWQGDYADTLTVAAADTEAKTCIELKDLQVSFA